MKSKSRKIEIGKGRSTENRAIQEVVQKQTDEWHLRVREQRTDADGVVDVLIELIKETKAGKIDREVISLLSKRLPIGYFVKAYERLNGRR
jgi:uncharacterized protein (UPF0548 family)